MSALSGANCDPVIAGASRLLGRLMDPTYKINVCAVKIRKLAFMPIVIHAGWVLMVLTID